jgi:5-formyltetrahydrofolate cyclo-ligase
MANPGSHISEKSKLRRMMRQRLDELSQTERHSRSLRICEKLCPIFVGKKRLGLFASTETEPDLDLLWTFRWLDGHVACYPSCEGNQLVFRPVAALGDLAPGKFGIRQPPPGKVIEQLDLIVVPGVAFTPTGERLGRGTGFYDRFLDSIAKDIPTIGVCFEFQCLSTLPFELHDKNVDLVISG